MLNPLNNDDMDDYVQRLNAQLRKMPPQERAEELRQHLEAQARAHEELGATPAEAMQAALRSFGDPARIGRKLYWEWRQTRRQRAVSSLLPFLLGTMIVCAVPLLCFAWMNSQGIGDFPGFPRYCLLLGFTPLLTGTLLGLCFPRRAVRLMVTASAIWIASFLLLNAARFYFWLGLDSLRFYQELFSWAFWDAFGRLTFGVLSAHIVSTEKLGRRYGLRLSDLRLRLR